MSYLTHWGMRKWPPFRRQYFQGPFAELKVFNFIQISLKCVCYSSIDDKSAWHRTGDKPLPGPMLTKMPDAEMESFRWIHVSYNLVSSTFLLNTVFNLYLTPFARGFIFAARRPNQTRFSLLLYVHETASYLITYFQGDTFTIYAIRVFRRKYFLGFPWSTIAW